MDNLWTNQKKYIHEFLNPNVDKILKFNNKNIYESLFNYIFFYCFWYFLFSQSWITSVNTSPFPANECDIVSIFIGEYAFK